MYMENLFAWTPWVLGLVAVILVMLIILGLWRLYAHWKEEVMKQGHGFGYAEALGLLPEEPKALNWCLEPGAIYHMEAKIQREDYWVVFLRRVTGSQKWPLRAYCTLELPPDQFIRLEDGQLMPMRA